MMLAVVTVVAFALGFVVARYAWFEQSWAPKIEERYRAEYNVRRVANILSAHVTEPYLRETDAISWTFRPNRLGDAWVCRLDHVSGDVQSCGASPVAALDGVLPWLAARAVRERAEEPTYRLSKTVAEALAAESREVVHIEDDE